MQWIKSLPSVDKAHKVVAISTTYTFVKKMLWNGYSE